MNTMKFLSFGLALLVVSTVHANNATDENACVDLLLSLVQKSPSSCCKSRPLDITTKCERNMDSEESKCKFFECFLQERGLMKNGKITKNMQVVKKEAGKNRPNLTNECFELALEDTLEKCPAATYAVCLFHTDIVACNDWDNSPKCMEGLVKYMDCTSSLKK